MYLGCVRSLLDILPIRASECDGAVQAFTVVVAFLLPEAEARFKGLLVALAARGARVLTIVFQLDRGGGLELRARAGNYVFLYAACS